MSSTRTFRPEQYIDFDITEDQLFPFIVKLMIVQYRSEPRFWVPKQQNQADSLHPARSHIRRPSSTNLVHTAALSEFSNSKASLPKGFGDRLDAKLRQIALNKHEFESDEPARRIFLAFYAAFDDNTKREIAKSKRVEHLLMKFISTSEKEIAKTLESGYQCNTTDHYTSLFCQLLLDILDVKNYSSTHNNLIVQLKRYKISLAQSATLRPNVTSANSSASSNGTGLAPEPPVYPTPSFNIRDMTYALPLITLFNKTESEIQQAIYRYKEDATLELAVAELKGMYEELRKNNYSMTYQRSDFDSESAYNQWKSTELASLDQLQERFISKNPALNNVHPVQPILVENHLSYKLTPPEPKSYFKLLVEMCLKRDSQNATENGDTFILSKESQDLISRVANFWQISPVTRSRLLLFISCHFYQTGVITLENLTEEVFPLSERIQTERDGTMVHWTEYDKGLSYLTMSSLYHFFVDQIIGLLAHIYDIQRPKIAPLMEFIVNFILPNVEFEEYPPLDPTKEQLLRAEQLINEAAYQTYTREIQTLPRDDTFSSLHITQIADVVVSFAMLLQKRYKRPLFQKINIPNIATETMLTDFAEDVKHMITHYIELQQARDTPISFEEVLTLYKKLIEVRSLYQQLKKTQFPFDIEAKLEPYVSQHFQTVSETLVDWVKPSFEKDQFLPSDEDQAGLTSVSTSDVFASFNGAVKVVAKLGWENETQVAKYYKLIMKGISAGIIKYSELVYGSFQKDLVTEEEMNKQPQYKTRREMWMDKAFKAVNGTVDVKPYQFHKETCVKLNDIERCLTELDGVESQVDSERQAAILARVIRQEPRSNNFFFTIKICEATGLKACDMNGLSDPYVTLIMDEKQIARTRTVYEDLNPVWDETFELTISSGRSLILTVWDENAALSHSLCGRTLINIDPSGFRDFDPQDFWLDLNPQGQLRITITMESERDDIRFYFGKSYRKLMRTETDMVRDIVDKFQAFIKFTISLSRLKALINPKFNIDTVASLFKGKAAKPKALGKDEIADALDPLFTFLNANFATLFMNLSDTLKMKVMTQTWEVVLDTLELLLIPPLSDKRTSQVPLNPMEKETLMIWLDALWAFFYHGGVGVPKEVLNSRKYQELLLAATNFYDWTTEDLKMTCERSASDSFQSIRARNMVTDMVRRSNTVMAHRNRRALREEKGKLAEAERQSTGQEIVILRILRLRGEYAFVSKRLQQLSNMSKTMAAEMYVNNARTR